jgi:hypothetical protein
VTRIVTVGERPTTIEPDHHIDSPNFSAPYINVLGHLRRVVAWLDVPEFVYNADDTFPMTTWTPGVYVRKYSIADHIRHYPNHGTYTKAVKASVSIMVAQGYDPEQVPCGAIHRPMLIDRTRAAATLDLIESAGGAGFKVLYVAGLDNVIPTYDPKIHGRGMPKPDADVISVVAESWRHNAGRLVRERFTEPSRYEDTQLLARR